MIDWLIIWEPSDYYLIFLMWFLPLLYKTLFWLYTIQLKEYRWDRFKEYIFTKQWKSALFSIFSILEIIFLVIALTLIILHFYWNIYVHIMYWVFYSIFFWYLAILNLFVFWKIIRNNILKPKLTGRLIILTLLVSIWLGIDFYYFSILNLFDYTYIYILSIFLFIPIIIFVFNFVSLPLVNFKKNKLMKSAINKSNSINNPIKIWITWSYWKSSVKEILSSILEQDWLTLKTPDNINTELWVSSVIMKKLNNNYKYFVAEMGAYKIWEIDLLWKIVNHKYWFLTAIWNQHMWLFWNQNNIIIWKSEIWNSVLKNSWTLYINRDNENIRKTKFNKKLNIVKYWEKLNSDAVFNILIINNWNTVFEFSYKEIKTKFSLNILWKHNILNISWIIAFLYDLWLNTTTIKKYLKNITLPKNTLEITKSWNNILIDDTYNLSDQWLLAWIEILRSYDSSYNKILILDDILELWKEAWNIHEKLWFKIWKYKNISKIYFCWVNYGTNFVKWLISGWFNKENIINNIGELEWNNVILFEWKKSKSVLKNIIN